MKLLKNEKGTAVLEWAIILPVLILLIFGMVEFASYLYNKVVITNACREGARAATVFYTSFANDPNGIYDPYNQAYIQTVVNDYASNYLIGFPRGTPNITFFQGCPTPFATVGADDFVIVTVRYDYNFLILPNFLPFLHSPFPVISTARMSCENRM